MKSLLALFEAILIDFGIACNTPTSRDLETLRHRTEHEGLSFLTITLSEFGKAFERGLEESRWVSNLSSFKTGRKTCLPAFMQGFMRLVFFDTGGLRNDPNPDAIDCIRQVCYLCKKIKLDCTLERQRSAVQSFVQCEVDLASFRFKDWSHNRDFKIACTTLYSGVTRMLNSRLCDLAFTPKHGPGFAIEGGKSITGNSKFNSLTWYTRLEPYFPSSHYLFSNEQEWVDHGHKVNFISKAQESSSKLVLVPKTLKSPRTIAIEPLCMQYAQQGVMNELVKYLESGPLKGRINFTDQSINGEHARRSSLTREFATVDLSEASDRVHSSLVPYLFCGDPLVYKSIFACRTRSTKLPNGDSVTLKKFASMGSALCFPIEAMVFFAMASIAVCKARFSRISSDNIRKSSSSVFVYGDDIVLPVEAVPYLREIMHTASLKLNDGKTFVKGFFRESCGSDFYKGNNVTPVYLRNLFPESREDAAAIISTVATRNLLYKKGLWNAARSIENSLYRILGRLSHVGERSSAVGLFSFLGTISSDSYRWNSSLFRHECRRLIPSSMRKKDKVLDYRHLMKYFIVASNRFGDSERIDFNKSVLRGSVQLKSRWVATNE